MKAELCQLLLLLLLLDQVSIVLALKCHECVGIGDCLNPTDCNNRTNYCLNTWDNEESDSERKLKPGETCPKSHAPPGEKTWVIKSCAYTCPPAGELYGSSPALCCRTDLCNSALTISSRRLLLISFLWAGASAALSWTGL